MEKLRYNVGMGRMRAGNAAGESRTGQLIRDLPHE